MIFNDKPFYNEPGHETRSEDSRAEAYNRNVEPLTAQYAMLYWLNERLADPDKPNASDGNHPALPPTTAPPAPFPTTPINSGPVPLEWEFIQPVPVYNAVAATRKNTDDPVWGDVIRKHFELKSDMIMATVREWEKKAHSMHTKAAMATAVTKLDEKIKLLGFQD
jgi:baculoviral IAP repeat-containing protein 6